MDPLRLLPGLTVSLVLLVSLISGPLVGAVDFSRDRETGLDPGFVPGEGHASVDVVSVPDRGRLVPARFAANGYWVRVPNATVDVSNLTGYPMVVYKVRIPALTYVAGTTHVFYEEYTGVQTLSMDRLTVNSTGLPRGHHYDAELLIIKREYERDEILYHGNISLAVGQ